ncbi:MAG: 2-dehydropantoate 2-reductase [Acidimicrobiia bacterium]|nr:2-dehydropantoate 2-reductase [Acidimicrobiia bacterium]
MTRIGILGAGAIGTSVGADLTEAGFDVALVDQWPAHVEALKRDGARVVMPDLDLVVPVKALHLCELASERPTFDVVFLAAKSYDTAWLASLIAPYLASDGVFVGLQNGMNEETIIQIVGPERTVASVVELSAEIYRPGYCQRDTTRAGTWFGVGELDGASTSRIEEVAFLLRHSAKVTVTDNVLGAKWTKLVANSMTMGPFSLFGLKNWDAAALPGITEISVAIGRETAAVGTALGYRLEPIFGLTAEEFSGAGDEILIKAMRTLLEHVGEESTTATVQDARKGRRTEIDHITGAVVRKGRDAGVPTPVNDAVLEIGQEISMGRRQMDPANLDLLKGRL